MLLGLALIWKLAMRWFKVFFVQVRRRWFKKYVYCYFSGLYSSSSVPYIFEILLLNFNTSCTNCYPLIHSCASLVQALITTNDKWWREANHLMLSMSWLYLQKADPGFSTFILAICLSSSIFWMLVFRNPLFFQGFLLTNGKELVVNDVNLYRIVRWKLHRIAPLWPRLTRVLMFASLVTTSFQIYQIFGILEKSLPCREKKHLPRDFTIGRDASSQIRNPKAEVSEQLARVIPKQMEHGCISNPFYPFFSCLSI